MQPADLPCLLQQRVIAALHMLLDGHQLVFESAHEMTH